MASTISLEEIKNETVDLVSPNLCSIKKMSSGVLFGCREKTWLPYVQERIPIEGVFEQLKSSREGLTSAEGENRLQIFGPNKLEEKKANFFYSLSLSPSLCFSLEENLMFE